MAQDVRPAPAGRKRGEFGLRIPRRGTRIGPVLSADVGGILEWAELVARARPRVALHALIAREYEGQESWYHLGHCDVCQSASRFLCDWAYPLNGLPSFRERLTCERCGLNTRQRLVVRLAREALGATDHAGGHFSAAGRAVYAYEQVTALYQRLPQALPGARIVGSEYLGYDLTPGTYKDGIRHEDALALSFGDDEFDLILSNDVYEHVPDYEKALAEACRVLKPGGRLIATIPFSFLPETWTHARLVDGAVEHLTPPQYHGNPLSAEGSLVFFTFGWDVLRACRRAGFQKATFHCTHSVFHLYMGEDLGLVLLADKAA